MVGWHRRPRPRFGRPRTGIRRRTGRRVPGRRVRQRGDAGLADARRRGTGRPVDAGDPDPRPHLLSGDLLRDAGQAVARRQAIDGARDRPRQGRPGRHRMRHRPAVVRPVRDDRTPGLDRRGLAAVHHATGQREGRRPLRVGGEPDRRRDPGPGDRVPDPERPGCQRRQHRRPRPLRGARLVHRPTLATVSTSPAIPTGRRPRCFVRPSPRRGWANTPSTIAETDIPGRETGRIRATGNRPFRRDCRSAGCGCSI